MRIGRVGEVLGLVNFLEKMEERIRCGTRLGRCRREGEACRGG